MIQLFPAILHIYYIYSYRLRKKCHCTKRGLKILRIYICQNSALKIQMDKKGQARIGYYRHIILNSCKFILDTVLQNMASSTAIFSLQPADYKAVSQCMVHNLSGFYFLCFHFLCFWQEGGGREAQKNPFFLCTIIFFFSKQVLFHTGFCSAARNWRELYNNLTILSFLDAYTQNQIQSKELTSLQGVWILNNS